MPVNREYAKRLKKVGEAVKKCPFTVVVWGPGETADTPQRQKRLKIREELESIVGPNGVLFSEDDDVLLKELREAGDYAAEYMQARAADALILIPESPGSLVEGALFAQELKGKTIVFAVKRADGGFAEKAYATLKVEQVEPEEWETCVRVRRKVREFVETLRVQKFSRKKKVFAWE